MSFSQIMMELSDVDEEREAHQEAKVEGRLIFWRKVAEANKLTLPQLAALGVNEMLRLGEPVLGHKFPEPDAIYEILQEPEFHE